MVNLLKDTFREWREDGANRLAAALAYYTTFSIAPLLVLIIAIAGKVAKEWANYLLTTENTDYASAQRFLKSFLRVLPRHLRPWQVCALRGEIIRQAHTIIHS